MTRRTLAALAMIALIGAGCSNTPAETGTTTSGGETSTTRDRTVTFASCMRKNGATEFPDPNGSNDQEFVEAIERAQDRSPAAWEKAIVACKDLQPPGLLGGKATPKQTSQRLKFAQCMRDNGVRDFPDPLDDGPVIDTNRIPSAAGRGARDIPGFQAAIEKCGDALTGALGDR